MPAEERSLAKSDAKPHATAVAAAALSEPATCNNLYPGEIKIINLGDVLVICYILLKTGELLALSFASICHNHQMCYYFGQTEN